MKTAVCLTALLAGLCAACMADPLAPGIPPSSPQLVVADLDPAAPDVFKPAMTFGNGPVGRIPAYGSPEILGSVRVPEPPSFMNVAIAMASIGIFGLYRLNYRPRKRRSRPHQRPLTVLR